MKNTNESGRSMVEMLGVLAIIGVLSVGGIMGYTTAMRKYKANEIAQAITMTVMAAKSANLGTGLKGNATFATLTGESTYPQGIAGTNLSANASSASATFDRIILKTDSNELCQAVQAIIGTNTSQPMYVAAANDCTNKDTTATTGGKTLWITVRP